MELPFVPFPPIEKLGLISDRRTAALVAADGEIGWWCAPDFDGAPLFASLLDARRGGFCRLGPEARSLGRQRYDGDTFALVTRWGDGASHLELTDLFLGPGARSDAFDGARRVIVRSLRAAGAAQTFRLAVAPMDAKVKEHGARHVVWRAGEGTLRLDAGVDLRREGDAFFAEGELAANARLEIVLAFDERGRTERVATDDLVNATLAYWRDYARSLTTADPSVRRSALVVHALTHAETAAVVATASASLPERIGGGRNFDYRYSWVRDGALAMALLAELGRVDEADRYIDWLSERDSDGPMPLQVVYRHDGSNDAGPVEEQALDGYRGSKPVRFGNVASKLYEIDTFGYLADCVLTHAKLGGKVSDKHFAMLARAADFAASHWQKRGASIWEIEPVHHFVVGKVLCWVTVDRAVRVAERTGRKAPASWARARDEIHREVCDRGFDKETGSFRQRYDHPEVDASLLLLPLSDFLPANDPKIVGTVARIERELVVCGHVHRFVPRDIPKQGDAPLGQEEGSFLLCTCWLARVLAKQGRVAESEATLARVRAAAGETGLLSEGIDARSGALLGNMPLVFTHVEYARALRAVDEAKRAAPDSEGT